MGKVSGISDPLSTSKASGISIIGENVHGGATRVDGTTTSIPDIVVDVVNML